MCAPSYNKDPNAPGYAPGPSPVPKGKSHGSNATFTYLLEERQKRKAEEERLGPLKPGQPGYGVLGMPISEWMKKVKERALVYSDTAGKRLQ